MKLSILQAAIIILCSLVFIANYTTSLGQTTLQIQSTSLTIYRDGLVHCKQELSSEAFTAEITMPLLSESAQNILLLDENMTAVDYSVIGNNLTTYTLGAIRLSIEYDTLALTKKEAEVWTLSTEYSYNLTISLPLNSTVIYISRSPLSIETKENIITMSLSPGSWEISYILPVLAPDEFPDQTNNTNSPSGFPLTYIAVAAATAIAVAIASFILYRKRKGPSLGKILKANPQLGKEDQAVIQFLKEKGGKAFEAELRQKLPDMPRTSLWRLVRRLERLEIVEVKKVGLENQVELKR